VFAVLPGLGILDLVKLLAGATALTILIAFFYPMIRGVNKGDEVVVVAENMPVLFGKIGRALVNAKKGEEIKVRLNDGREVVGILEEYEGLFSPPKVKILFEKTEKMNRGKGEYY
ncbi:MAG: flagella basal body P-ring formation protein FlgA, partial [Candidatus Anstonellales archaeon]